MTTPNSSRLKRLCDVCGQYDDHPRHVQNVAADSPDAVPSTEFLQGLGDVSAAAVGELMDPTTVVRHLDCCASRGCPTCQATEAVTGGRRGTELVAHIESGVVNHLTTTSGEPAATATEA